MIVHLLQRALVALVRVAVAALLILVLIELGGGVFARAERHVWEIDLAAAVPEDLAARPLSWSDLLAERVAASARVMLLSTAGALLTGLSWGLLGARWRKFGGARLLAAPFAAFACVPGFWWVIAVAVYSYFHWGRPGFANDLVVEEGPDLLTWWHAAVIALPVFAVGAAWQIRAVASVIEGEAARPWVRTWFVEGRNDEEIFYGHLLGQAWRAALAKTAAIWPAMLGALVVLETAFRFEGVGSLLVESIRLSSHPGMIFAALTLTIAAAVGSFLAEAIAPPREAR